MRSSLLAFLALAALLNVPLAAQDIPPEVTDPNEVIDDVRIMEGGGFRIVHAVPSQDLVIFRHGPSVPDWDGAFLVNTAIRGLRAESDQ